MFVFGGEVAENKHTSSFGIIGHTELDDPGASRAAVGFILDLSSLNFPNGSEKFN